jgi:hypothetical protein
VVPRVEGFAGVYFQLCLEYRSWIFLEAQKRMEQTKKHPFCSSLILLAVLDGIWNVTKKNTANFSNDICQGLLDWK